MPPLWGPKKRCRADRSNVAPDPLVDPGNPSYHPQARATPHPARSHHRMVALATRSPSRSKASAPQAKIATVVLESVRRLQAGLQSFMSMRRIDARRKNAKAFRLKHSQSLAKRRQGLSHAMGRSTIQRLGKTTKPLT